MTDQSSLEKELYLAKQKIAHQQEQLLYADRMYQELFEGAGESIFIIDLDTDKIIRCNNNASRRLGYVEDELIGVLYEDIEITEVKNSTTDFVYKSAFSGTYIYECQHVHKDGQLIPVEVSSRLVEIDGQQVFMNFVRNIAVRKEAQERKIELTLQQERMQLLMQFIQNAGHEFRTPLSIIKTSIYLMSKSDNPTVRASHGDKINDQVDRISDFVNTMLLMTRLETEAIPLEQTINLVELLNNVCYELGEKYGNSPKLNQGYASTSPAIVGNMDYLPRAFYQLILNAYQFTPADKSISIAMAVDEQMIQIVVLDEGVGMSEDTLANAYKLFWREDESQNVAGFGLGLPIAKRIIELHGGTIDITSELGSGTQVIVRLPISS